MLNIPLRPCAELLLIHCIARQGSLTTGTGRYPWLERSQNMDTKKSGVAYLIVGLIFSVAVGSFGQIPDMPLPTNYQYVRISPLPAWIILPPDNPTANASIPIPFPDLQRELTGIPTITLFVQTVTSDVGGEGWQLEGCEVSKIVHDTMGTYITVSFPTIPTDARASLHWVGSGGDTQSRIDADFEMMTISEYNKLDTSFEAVDPASGLPDDIVQKGSNCKFPSVFGRPNLGPNQVSIPVYAMLPSTLLTYPSSPSIKRISLMWRGGGQYTTIKYPRLRRTKKRPHYPYPDKPPCNTKPTTKSVDKGWHLSKIEHAPPVISTPLSVQVSEDVAAEIPGGIAKASGGGKFTITICCMMEIARKHYDGYLDFYTLASLPDGSCGWQLQWTKHCQKTMEFQHSQFCADGQAVINMIAAAFRKFHIPLPTPPIDAPGRDWPPFSDPEDCDISYASM